LRVRRFCAFLYCCELIAAENNALTYNFI
jgi:hypothetical protein